MTDRTASGVLPEQDRDLATRSVAIWSLVLFLGVAVLALVGTSWVRGTTAMFDLGQSPNPYFLPAHALSLYVLTPLATLATTLFFLAPGLMLAATYGYRKGAAYWLICAFAWSVATILGATTIVQLLSGIVLKNASFWVVVVAVGLVSLALMVRRMANGGKLLVQLGEDRVDLWVGGVIFIGVLIAFAPKFYWENFTGDGHGALKFSRLLIHALWPFWMPDAGPIAKAPGLSMVLFVIPNSFFVRLWGEMEFSVRAPILLYGAMLYPVMAGLIRTGRAVVLGAFDHILIALTVALVMFVLIYSGGYNPYFGDSPMPAVRETLAIALFLGYVLAFAEDRLKMMLLTGLLASMTIPTGGLWLAMIAFVGWLTWHPRDVRRTNASIVVVLVAAMVAFFVPRLIHEIGFYYPSDGEFSPKAIVDRMRYVALTDWQRFLFVVVPCGIVPILGLFAWRRHDSLSRLLTIVAALFFFFFYFQGYRVLLHHFAPVMLVPVIVFWRSMLNGAGQSRGLKALTAVGVAAAFWLSWPAEMKLHNFDREIGRSIEASGPRFDNAPREPGDVFRGFRPAAINTAHILLGDLFPIGYTDQDAKERFYGAPLVWWYYSEQPKPEGQVINYRMKPIKDATPADGKLIREVDGYGLYVADMALYEKHTRTLLPTDTGAKIYVVPRNMMFGGGSTRKDRIVIDIVHVVRALIGR